MRYVRHFDDIRLADLSDVGGKNASIGELRAHLQSAGVRVPGGFATTADAFRELLRGDGLAERISQRLRDLDTSDVAALAATGRAVRDEVARAPLPAPFVAAVREAYAALEAEAGDALAVAVRSSATAEDLPDASFAGQQETMLNVRGVDAVLDAMRTVFASLFTDRAIAYRVHHGFDHDEVALSIGVQQMVRSDLGASGVAFTLDTETGFRDVVFVTSSYGLGELLVQGGVEPDEFYLYKPALRAGRDPVLSRRLGGKERRMVYGDDGDGLRTVDVEPEARRRFSLDDADLRELGRIALAIEEHYGAPMDIEWGKDGVDGALYVLQARPETVESRSTRVLERFTLRERGTLLATGRAVGARIGIGRARRIVSTAQMGELEEGDVLVTEMTDPDWEPIMTRASAIVTDRGGRTCHAAIVARELGIPAVVGCGDATERVPDGDVVTVSCAEGDEGRIYEGELRYDVQRIELDSMPELPVDITMNVASPERAFSFSRLPHKGVGLARIEFVVNNAIGVHPRALLELDTLEPTLREQVLERIAGYPDGRAFYVAKLAEGIATIASAFAPERVIVRLSDFKTNEYAHLLGGEAYEPKEENPMIGWRGASRYRSEAFRDCFALECEAIRHVREGIGLGNLEVMIPFVRTVGELREVLELMAAQGLERGREGLRVIMMCEVPSNALLAPDFLEHVDGFSIGSNDLTQLTLALDRDSGLVADLFSESDPAVLALMERAITACKEAGKYVGICGQGPSDDPDFARWLLDRGIDSISLNPDSVLETWLFLAGEDPGGDRAAHEAASAAAGTAPT
jgi:pyruvate, water dikinase